MFCPDTILITFHVLNSDCGKNQERYANDYPECKRRHNWLNLREKICKNKLIHEFEQYALLIEGDFSDLNI